MSIIRTLIPVLILYLAAQTSNGQKIKNQRFPVAWEFELSPKIALDPSVKRNQVIVKTNWDPLSFGDELDLAAMATGMSLEKKKLFFQEAAQDTITKWASKYIAITRYPFVETSTDPEIIITLTTESFKIDNLQLEIDYEDGESILGEVNISARLRVEYQNGEPILDEVMPYEFDFEEDNTKYLKLKYFFFDPFFKTKLKLTKKPDKKRALLQRKVKKYEADILEEYFQRSGQIISDNLVKNRKRAYSSINQIKDKSYEDINTISQEARVAINSLNALSKKKRRTLSEITPTLEAAIKSWKEVISNSSNLDLQKLFYLNIASVELVLGNVEESKKYFEMIPESKDLKSGILQGSFKYYVIGLSEAIATKEKYGDRAKIYEAE